MRNRDRIFDAQSTGGIIIGHVVDFFQVPNDFGGFVFRTTESEKVSWSTPLSDHAEKPILFGPPHRHEDSGEVGFHGLVGIVDTTEESVNRHSLAASATFQQIVNASGQLPQLLLPQKIKDVLGVFSETRVFVQQARFCVFGCRYLLSLQ